MEASFPYSMKLEKHYDVVILGGGMAGLTLARHLLLETEKNILLIERRPTLPPAQQKVGESSVQIAGYYFGKVLDLEEHLMSHHYMKYNLRFYWPRSGHDQSYEDYSQSYLRTFSNIASYQLDRNVFEAELLRLNQADPRFHLALSAHGLDVELATEGFHTVSFVKGDESTSITATWVVDTTGRGRFLARRKNMTRRNTVDHGAFFWWVDGLIDIEKLSDASRRERRLRRHRRHQGHLSSWMATNHFCDEGMWFWVIPLHGKTSLGLVYDNSVISPAEVFSVDKVTELICRRFPLFARDLPFRKVLGHGGYKSFAHDCAQTIDASRWAIAGEAGRFSDPLYSPGSDLIAIYNTLIVDAIATEDDEALASKCQLAEQLMRAIFQAYIPTYEISYDALGDQEVFSLKYTWELTTYFAIFVFPFINDLYTDKRFVLGFLRMFSALGPLNRAVQQFLSDYFQWKKRSGRRCQKQVFFDFTEVETLKRAAEAFFQVGLTATEGKQLQNRYNDEIRELARFIVSYAASMVLEDPRALRNRRFVAGFDLSSLRFDPDDFRDRYAACVDETEGYDWTLDPSVLDRFRDSTAHSEIAESMVPQQEILR